MITDTHGQDFQCPWLSESRPCNIAECATDCLVGDWTSFESCDVTCGGGNQERIRHVQRQASAGGAECPTLVESQTCEDQDCAVDCVVTTFNPWSACTLQCGNGTETRQRSITTNATNGGVACPPLTEEASCNTDACAIDCVQQAWGNWSACSLTCGWGNKERSRDTTVQPQHGGEACEDNHETQACEDVACPVDCGFGSWDAWSTCTKSCGRGAQTRHRDLLTQSEGTGDCASLDESRECSSTSCPYDCVVSEFLTWSDCDTSCGGGSRTQRRTVVSPATNGGKACPSLEQVEDCHEHFCPTDCTWGSWTDWGSCSETCGPGGHELRQRTAQVAPTYGGLACDNSAETRTCSMGPCPVDCVMGAWTTFGDCSATCAGGQKTRSRTIVSREQNVGAICGVTEDPTSCNTFDCPINCVVTGWSAWSVCNAVCGTGRKARSRVVVTEAYAGGTVCPALSALDTCDSGPCAHNVVVSEWSAWDACTASCAGGSMTRTRTATPQGSDNVVLPLTSQTKECNVSPCPVNCTVGDWHMWGDCDATCGPLAHNGVKRRTRSVATAATFQGTICPHLTDSAECGELRCPVDCQVGDWGEFTTCDKSCNTGDRYRQRHPVGFVTAFGGQGCPDLTDHEACGTIPCPTDCEIGEWTAYGECSLTCGGGVRVQTRVVVPPAAGGAVCPLSERNDACEHNPCPIHCDVGDWQAWSSCSASCRDTTDATTNTITRVRAIITHAEHGGYVCPMTLESDHYSCNAGTTAEGSFPNCPIDCKVTQFSEWSTCAMSCGTGFQYKEREVIGAGAEEGGAACPSLQMARDCNSALCPVDCALGAWSSYTDCSITCGTAQGQRERSRAVISQPLNGGEECPTDVSWENCAGYSTCPEDDGCTLEQWGSWSTCDKTCYGLDGVKGDQTRTRTVTPASDECIAFGSQTRDCAIPACSIDCLPGDWSGWTACTKSCNGGTRHRFREPLAGFEGNEYGAKCTDLTDDEICGSGACPINCELSPLSEGTWTGCSKTCGSGTRTLSRRIVTQPDYGGLVCGATDVTESCNDENCPVDCEHTPWSGWSTCVASHSDSATATAAGLSHICKKAQFMRAGPPARFGGVACPTELNRWAPCDSSECSAPPSTSCSHVKCVFYRDDDTLGVGEGHIRVFHHNAEQNGDQHVCKHVGGTSPTGIATYATGAKTLGSCECTCSVSVQ